MHLETADPVVETCAQVRKGRARDAKERLDLLRRELEPAQQTGAGGIAKEVFLEILVGEQPAECPLHIPLAHAVLPIMLQEVGRNVHPGCPIMSGVRRRASGPLRPGPVGDPYRADTAPCQAADYRGQC
jgi:hypothetical protein